MTRLTPEAEQAIRKRVAVAGEKGYVFVENSKDLLAEIDALRADLANEQRKHQDVLLHVDHFEEIVEGVRDQHMTLVPVTKQEVVTRASLVEAQRRNEQLVVALDQVREAVDEWLEADQGADTPHLIRDLCAVLFLK